MTRLLAVLLPLLLTGCFSQSPAPSVDRSPTAQSRVAAPTATPGGPGYYTVKKGDTLYRIALENGQDYKDIAAWNSITNPSSIKEGQVLRVAPPGSDNAGAVVAKPIATGSTVESRPLDKGAAPSSVASNDGVKREPKVNKEPYSDEAYSRLNKSGEGAGKAPEPVKQDSRPDSKPEPKPEPKPEAAPAAAVPAATAGADDVAWAWPSSGKLLAPYSESGNKGVDIGGKAGDAVLAASEGKVVYAGTGLRGYGQLVIVKHNNTFLSAYAHNQKILVKEGQQVSKGQKIAEMGNTDSETVKLHFEIRRQGKPTDPMAYLPKR